MAKAVAALVSGGLDSCAMVAHLARESTVHPLYVKKGLHWEEAEVAALERFLKALGGNNIRSLVVLPMPVETMYGDHWSLSGVGVPSASDPDERVYLPGRNVLLLAAAGVWCSTHSVHRIALGSLLANPFPDATPEFFADMARLMAIGMSHELTVETPFRARRKAEIIREYSHLPLELTLTCNSPRRGAHCGRCNKCYERRTAFEEAGMEDRTSYANTK